MRKTNLERLLRGRSDGIFINSFEVGAIGPDLFHAACDMGSKGSYRNGGTANIGADGRLLDQGQEQNTFIHRSRYGESKMMMPKPVAITCALAPPDVSPPLPPRLSFTPVRRLHAIP